MATNYGADTSCITDVPLIDIQVTDPKVLVAQRAARRLTTSRGGLASVGDDPDFGFDVRQLVLQRVSAANLAQAQAQIAAEAAKDEEVQSVSVLMNYVASGALVITVRLVGATGPFTLVLNVTALTVDLVFQP